MDLSPKYQRVVTDTATTARIGAVRTFRAASEIAVRTVLRRPRNRLDRLRTILAERPDLVVAGKCKVIFMVDCFWLQHKQCLRANVPKGNQSLWREKFTVDALRDQRNITQLRLLGLGAIVVWKIKLPYTNTVHKRIGKAISYE